MKRIRNIFKNNVFCFILGSIIFGIVGVSAATYFESSVVTYDNSESGLSSTNVQGAIDELYDACKTPTTGGNSILEKVPIVTTGDGLYEDEYEEGRYFYKGANPNNYVTFNNERAGWRIISVETNGSLKLIRNSSIGSMAWDESNNNNWARPATLQVYLNNEYYNNLTSDAKKQIIYSEWSIGKVKSGESNLNNQINDENSIKWFDNIGLPTLSEYIRSNSNTENCGTFALSQNNDLCKSTNWMKSSDVDDCWTITAYSNMFEYSVFMMSLTGYISNATYDGASLAYGVQPVLYLSPSIKIISGNGSKNNPYQLSL